MKSHMNSIAPWAIKWLLAAIGLQLIVLASQLASAAYPHWAGKDIQVKTTPFDPRSLFRGNYARLNYSFSRLNAEQLGLTDDEAAKVRIGEPVYVTLKQGNDNLYAFHAASMNKPAQLSGNHVLIMGHVKYRRWRSTQTQLVDYGIEAYFAPKERALALEHDLRRGGIAVLKVTDSGRAALVDVISNPKPDDA